MDTTDSNGEYGLIDLPPDNYVVCPEKEYDTGSAISAYDASWILQYVVGLKTFTPYQLIAGDVSGNGSVSAFDASKILQYNVGLINQFPVMPDSTHFWRFVPEDFPISQSNWNKAPDSIAYLPLNRDTTDNYFGIIYGDVTGNWYPSDRDFAKSIVATATTDIRLEDIYGKSGDRISLPVYMDNGSDIVAMRFTLEYDPQVTVIAEWRDLETLFQDHVDNAAVDGIIEQVNSGKSIPSNNLLLPLFRVVKLYSWIMNTFGLVGPIPEGMSPEAALRHEAYSEFHSQIKNYIILRSEEFQKEKGYRPPYWILVKFANEYLVKVNDE